MTSGLSQGVSSGILLPASLLHTSFFVILSAFVAINTIIYVALAVAKILPKVYIVDWIKGANRRTETRSIYPNASIFGKVGATAGLPMDSGLDQTGSDRVGE